MTEQERIAKRYKERLNQQLAEMGEAVAKLQAHIATDGYNNQHFSEWTNWTEGHMSKLSTEVAGSIITIRALESI